MNEVGGWWLGTCFWGSLKKRSGPQVVWIGLRIHGYGHWATAEHLGLQTAKKLKGISPDFPKVAFLLALAAVQKREIQGSLCLLFF